MLNFIMEGRVTGCVSQPLLTEYQTVLARPKFRAIDPKQIARAPKAAGQGEKLDPDFTRQVSRHEPDNRFLECAEAAQADYLVTGNTRHFPKAWEGTGL